MNITLREFDAFYYRYSNMIKDIECTMGIKISELKAKSYAAVADMIDTVLKRFISENENNPYYIFLLKPKMEKYKKKKNVTSAKSTDMHLIINCLRFLRIMNLIIISIVKL